MPSYEDFVTKVRVIYSDFSVIEGLLHASIFCSEENVSGFNQNKVLGKNKNQKLKIEEDVIKS